MGWEWGPFHYAVCGGLLAELVSVGRLRYDHPSTWPEHYRLPSFYIITLLFIAVGGFIANVYARNQVVSEFLAMNIGASWPLILERLFGSASTIALGRTD